MNRLEFWRRYLAVLLGMVFLGALLCARLVWIMVLHPDDYLERRQWRVTSTVHVEGPRGTVVDRHGRELARSVETTDLAFNPRHFFLRERAESEAIRELLMSVTDLDEETWRAWETADPRTLRAHVVLARDLEVQTAEEVVRSARARRVGSIHTERSYGRVYPQKEVAGAVLGFVNAEGRGAFGLESSWDAVLQGQRASYRVGRDVRGRSYLGEAAPDRQSLAGATLQLALDTPLQRRVEELLEETLERFRAESGVVIVSEPATGEILVMANAPAADPNMGGALSADRWMNAAVQAAWEPGSVFKTLTFALAIEHGIAAPDSVYSARGGTIVVGDRTIRDTVRNQWNLTLTEAFQISANTVTVQLGQALGSERMEEGFRRFGYGSRLRSGLPAEASYPLPRAPWNSVDAANRAFGQGVSGSPLLLHMAMGALANGGLWVPPRLVLRAEHVDGTVEEVLPEEEPRQVVSERTALQMRELLIRATQGRGTGRAAVPPGVLVAGKTGTAEIYDVIGRRYSGEYIAGFSGFVPADDPRLVITVMIVKPDRTLGYFGGTVAAPLFREVAMEALRREGVFLATVEDEPDEESAPRIVAEGGRPVERSAGELTEEEGATAILPDVRGLGLRTAIRDLQTAGFSVEVRGQGPIANQSPAAGALVEPGSVVTLVLGGYR